MKKKYTKKQITEAIAYWEKQLRAGNYKKVVESDSQYKNLFGISGLQAAEIDSYYDCPKYLVYHGNKENIGHIAFAISHGTVRIPYNSGGCESEWRMLCKAYDANNALFKDIIIKALADKPLNAWWDDSSKKWETNEKILIDQNAWDNKWSSKAALMNGL